MKEKIIVNAEYVLHQSKILVEESPLNFFYEKEIFFSSGFNNEKPILYQLVGNLGAYPNENELNNLINVFVISNALFRQLKEGIKDQTLKLLEQKLNSKGQPFNDLLIVTESDFIEFVKKRASFYSDQCTQDLLKSLSIS